MLDLDRPPYRDYVQLLDALRRSDDVWPLVAYEEHHTAERGTHDVNGSERARLVHILQLRAAPEDLGLVRRLLDAEIEARHKDSFQGAGDVLAVLSLLLLELGDGDPEDTWRFWSAKRANFDTFAGGYDIDFVFAQRPADEVLALLQERSPDAVHALRRYDIPQIVDGLERWRGKLAGRYPRMLEDLTTRDAEAWAEVFGDQEAQERFGLLHAMTAVERARLFRRLGEHRKAVPEWRAAAALAESAWDTAARLRDAVVDAAKVPMAAMAEVEQLDALRAEIPCWNEVGLGRMATQACYALAAVTSEDEGGQELWATAERWRRELESFTLVGLRTAVTAAERWGTPEDVQALRHAVDVECARIHG